MSAPPAPTLRPAPRPPDRFAQVIAVCPSAYLEVDAAGIVTEWNDSATELLGWARDEIVGQRLAETVLVPGEGPLPVGDRRQCRELLHSGGHRMAVNLCLVPTGGGEGRGVGAFLSSARLTTAPSEVAGDGGTTSAPGPAGAPPGVPASRVATDREAFVGLLADRLATGRSRPGSVAVVLVDLDRFKAVNNAVGHTAGDRILGEVAVRLAGVADGTDVVAHPSGDEYLVLVTSPEGDARTAATRFAERATEALATPFELEGTELYLDASFGIALNTFGVDDAEALLVNAESAMYRAKRSAGPTIETFGEGMRIEQLDRMAIEHSLRGALERDELVLHYQPVVEIGGATTVGVEALVRWRHPDQGVVTPGRFIPVAEESGLIAPIGAWVLEQACAQLRDWQRRGRGARGTVEVNLSARQLDSPAIVRTVERILARTGLPPDCLVLEITESALMADAEASLWVLRALKETGVLLAIDDFGTGYSSLAYLQRFPLDLLKVDRSFVQQLEEGDQGRAIVGAVVDLAHAVGLEVVAEGVESAEQLQTLRALQCDYAQGYLFSRPMPATEVVAAFTERLSA